MAATPCFLSTWRAFSARAVLMRSTLMRSCQSAMAVPKVSFEAILTMVVLLSSDHAPYLFKAFIGRQERKGAAAKRAMGDRRGPPDFGPLASAKGGSHETILRVKLKMYSK